jgi:hypothetical protein
MSTPYLNFPKTLIDGNDKSQRIFLKFMSSEKSSAAVQAAWEALKSGAGEYDRESNFKIIGSDGRNVVVDEKSAKEVALKIAKSAEFYNKSLAGYKRAISHKGFNIKKEIKYPVYTQEYIASEICLNYYFRVKEEEQVHDYVEIVRKGLSKLFDKLDISDSDRTMAAESAFWAVAPFSSFTAKFGSQSSWRARISNQVQDRAYELPGSAPAAWKNDKLPDDTPPDFIKRHYGPEGLDVLRADGAGLKRNDLKKLDPSAYTALANWLRNNELPDDCPLPTLSEALKLGANNIPLEEVRAARALIRRYERQQER